MPNSLTSRLVVALQSIPRGRVVTDRSLAAHLGVSIVQIPFLIDQALRAQPEIVGWHRVVAKGGAIGRGCRCAEQIARLAADGVVVSAAGIVQDMERVTRTSLSESETARGCDTPVEPPAPTVRRSIGMRSRP